MVDRHGIVCEYDGYKLPPAPESVTPEMKQLKKKLLLELDRLVAEANARIDADEFASRH